MGRFPCIVGRIAALRLPVARPRRPSLTRASVPTFRQEATGPPRFLGIPCVYAPCSLTPAGPPCRAVAPNRATARRCCRTPLEQQRLPQRYFGALSHGIYTRCLRFAARVTPGPRKTRFRAVANLLRVDGAKLTSTGIQHEVSLSSWHPPHPGLSWRTPIAGLARLFATGCRERQGVDHSLNHPSRSAVLPTGGSSLSTAFLQVRSAIATMARGNTDRSAAIRSAASRGKLSTSRWRQ